MTTFVYYRKVHVYQTPSHTHWAVKTQSAWIRPAEAVIDGNQFQHKSRTSPWQIQKRTLTHVNNRRTGGRGLEPIHINQQPDVPLFGGQSKFLGDSPAFWGQSCFWGDSPAFWGTIQLFGGQSHFLGDSPAFRGQSRFLGDSPASRGTVLLFGGQSRLLGDSPAFWGTVLLFGGESCVFGDRPTYLRIVSSKEFKVGRSECLW